MRRSHLRIVLGSFPAVALLSFLLTACGGGGADGGSSQELVIHGTWVSNAATPARGRFTLTSNTRIQGFDGTLSGTLQFYGENGALVTEEAVTGTLSEENIGSSPYWDIQFSTGDGKLSFFAPSYDGHDSNSKMVGQFTNTKSGDTVQGKWHSNPTGGPVECVIDRAFYQTGYTFLDLAWDGSRLVAVATPTGGTSGIYEIDVSQTPPLFTQRTFSNPPPGDLMGIAWDGSRYWVNGTVFSAGQFTLSSFDSSWSEPPTAVTGSGSRREIPDQIAYWDGFLWFAPFLNFGSYQIAPNTGAVTSVPALVLERPNGLDSDGTSLWIASGPPGGIWGPLMKYDRSGTILKTIYAPESDTAGAVACEGSSFLWVASGQNLYRLDVR